MYVHRTAEVSSAVNLGSGVTIWAFSQIRENVTVGDATIIGSYTYLDCNVKVGKNCKIQNRALIYDPAVIHDGVFIGPGVILTNDKYPRSVTVDCQIKTAEDWKKTGVEIREGASIGAGAVCIGPVTIGRWALVGAGSVVSKSVKNHALVMGNPARQVGWVGYAGVRLREFPKTFLSARKL